MLILTGPSASGKTEIAKILICNYNFKKFVTYTTRPPRKGEVDGVDYHFISTVDFLKLKDKDEFIETTYYNNNYYGTRKSDINYNKVLILDPSGVNKFKKKLLNNIVIVFLNTPEDLRIKRMQSRNDDERIIEARIISDRQAFSNSKYDHIDYTYKNEIIDLDILAKEILNTYQLHMEKIKR